MVASGHACAWATSAAIGFMMECQQRELVIYFPEQLIEGPDKNRDTSEGK